MRHSFPWMGITALACSFSGTCHADERDFTGIVTHVFDGDSFMVLPTDKAASRENEVEVRLRDIDAPEKDQPHADQARHALIKMIDGRRVYVDVVDVDRFHRKVAMVRREPDSLDVTRALVHDGHAWVNRKYIKDQSLIALEEAAKSKRIGLWSHPSEELVPPWSFRRQREALK